MLELEIQILPGRLVVVRRTDMAGRRTTFEPHDGRYRPLIVDHAQLADLLLARRFEEYGARLWELLFAEPGLASFYEQARAGGHLRMILDIAASEPELHGLLWEAMHARDAPPVAFDEGLTFVRYLSSRTWRERPLAGECEIALMFPSASAGYRRLGYPDEAGERDSLADLAARITAATPSAPGWRLSPQRGVSRTGLIAALEGRKPAKVVCLVCHGRMDRGAAFLALDAEDGAAVAMVEVEALARAVAEAESGPGIPSLVILAACQSAGDGTNEPAQAFGSAAIRLVRAGIPCVLAVYGDVDKEVIVEFLRELLVGVLGQGLSLEAAVQSARWSLSRNKTFGDAARSHAIQPVLYSRASGDYGLVPRQRARPPEDEEQLRGTCRRVPPTTATSSPVCAPAGASARPSTAN